MSAMLILPKVRKSDGVIIATTIDPSLIKGCEPKELVINHKKYAGTKAFLDNGNSFYVLAAPMAVTGARIAAQQMTNGLLAVDSLKELPSYAAEVKGILQSVEKMKALASGE